MGVGDHHPRARSWTVGTAGPGTGKSPVVEDMRRCLFEVLEELSEFAPGCADDSFHLQQGMTYDAALARLSETGG